MTSEVDLPPRVTRAELAAFWRLTPRSLERYLAMGIGPRPIRIGGRLLYRREDVLAFEAERLTGADD
jgi:hypothetical protein